MTGMHPLHEQNRRAWNEATVIHQRHRGDLAAFFRAGGSTLYPFEVEDLGDLRCRRVLHLQCNDGQDSLSLARLGAHVTGVDISDVAIAAAQALSEAAGISAEFLRADVLDLRPRDRPSFDVVSAGLDYVGESGEGAERNYQWQWSLGDVVEAVMGAGLRIRYLREHPYTFFRRWPQLIERDRCYFLPEGVPAIPLSFTMRADRG